MNNNEYVVMSKDELDDLIFHASRRANDKLFRGLYPFLADFRRDFETVIKDLEYIRYFLQNQEKKKANNTTSEHIKQNGESLPESLSNLSDEQKKNMAEMIKKTIDENKFNHVSQTSKFEGE